MCFGEDLVRGSVVFVEDDDGFLSGRAGECSPWERAPFGVSLQRILLGDVYAGT
jgi:hypothetical protein